MSDTMSMLEDDNAGPTVKKQASESNTPRDTMSLLEDDNVPAGTTTSKEPTKEATPGFWESAAPTGYENAGKNLDTYGPSVGDLGLGLAGAAAAPYARTLMNQKNVYGSPEYVSEQNASAGANIKNQDAINKAQIAHDTLGEASIQHSNTHDVLSQQLKDAADAHAESTSNIENLNREKIALDAKNAVVPNAEHPPLIELPRGGSATENYALKFGHSAPEAQNALSMSGVQSDIPNIAENYKKIQNLAPGYRPVSGLTTLVDTSSPKYVQAAQELIAKNAAPTAATQASDAATTQAKAINQMNLDAAKLKAANTAKQLQAAQINLNTHVATPPVKASDLVANRAAISAGEKATSEAASEAAARGTMWGGLKAGANAVGKVAGKMVPVVGAVTAPIEANDAYNEYQKGNYGRAAVHGLGAIGGALQASAFPPAMALGDVAQLPSMAMSGLDAYKAYQAAHQPVKKP